MTTPATLGPSLAQGSHLGSSARHGGGVRTSRRALLLAVLAADLRQRTRSTRFRVVALLAALAAWWCFPAADAGYLIVAIGTHHRGFYSSAWVGMVLATMTMLWSLVGFYVVRGTLQRDFDTRVWQLLGATSMSRTGYLLAKWASHLLVLLAILAATLVVGLAAQWVRAEDRHVDVWELAKPSLVIALPMLAMCATLVVWFDMIPWLRRTAGNVLFFFAWMGLLSAGAAQVAHDQHAQAAAAGQVVRQQPWASGVTGLEMLEWAVETQVRPQYPGGDMGDGFCIGCGSLDGRLERFTWTHWSPSPPALGGRLAWLAAAVAGVLLAVPLLDWAAGQATGAATRAATRSPRALRWLDAALAPLHRLPSGVLVAAEARLLLRMRPLWWWAAWLPLWGAQAFGARHAVALATLGAWALLMDAFSRAGLREQEHQTGGLVWTAPGGARRLLRARASLLVGLAWIAAAPALAHEIAAQPAMVLPTLAIGASLALWGMAAATLAGNPRIYELAFLVAAYATLQGAPWLDAAARGPGVALAHAGGLVVALALLAAPREALARPLARLTRRPAAPAGTR